jgi:hypothetical protein
MGRAAYNLCTRLRRRGIPTPDPSDPYHAARRNTRARSRIGTGMGAVDALLVLAVVSIVFAFIAAWNGWGAPRWAGDPLFRAPPVEPRASKKTGGAVRRSTHERADG